MEQCSSFEHDDRETEPNQTGYRRDQFGRGWREADSGVSYSARTLKSLTWNNLGYRLGCLFGPASPPLIDAMYDWSVRQQREKLNSASRNAAGSTPPTRT